MLNVGYETEQKRRLAADKENESEGWAHVQRNSECEGGYQKIKS